MKLSAASREELESFFREFLNDGGLRVPPLKIYSGRAVGWLTGAAEIRAMALGRRVLVAPENLGRGEEGRRKILGRLLAHEVMHVLQAERAGLARFLLAYLREYFGGLMRAKGVGPAARRRAYSAISFEREAREAERAYAAWRGLRDAA